MLLDSTPVQTCDCAILPLRLHGEHLSQYPPLLPSKSPHKKLLNALDVISVWKFRLTNRSCPCSKDSLAASCDGRQSRAMHLSAASGSEVGDCQLAIPRQVVASWCRSTSLCLLRVGGAQRTETGLPTKGEVLLCEAAFGLLYSRMRTCMDKNQQPWTAE